MPAQRATIVAQQPLCGRPASLATDSAPAADSGTKKLEAVAPTVVAAPDRGFGSRVHQQRPREHRSCQRPKLGVYGHVAYNTRHTYASLALSAGVNVAHLARQLGHSNAGTLPKHYGRWIEDGEGVRQSKELNEVFCYPAGWGHVSA